MGNTTEVLDYRYMQLQVQKLHSNAKMPAFAHDTDAGLDLCCVEEVCIEPGQRVLISTGLAFAIPDGYTGLMWDKSGVSHKRGLKVYGGVIDAGYRGEIFVGLYNMGDTVQVFQSGDKISQIVIQKVEHPEILAVDSLNETQRGDGAFGSTGK